jgi:hypothetical protein
MANWVSILGPVLAATIIVVGGAVAYRWQKTIDCQTALIELRRKAYRRYLTAFISMANTPDAVAEITIELFQCEFDLLVVANVCKAMREDCFEESNLTLNEYQKLVPFK